MLTVTSPPLKEVRELAQRSMCKGGDVHKPFVRKKNLVKTFYIQKKVSIFVEKLSN